MEGTVADGLHPDFVALDELDSDVPRREVLIQREDGSTYSAQFPEDVDFGQVLESGETVVADVG